MEPPKIIYISDDSYGRDPKIECKDIAALDPWQKQDIISACVCGLREDRLYAVLTLIGNTIGEKEFHKYAKSIGYDRITRIKDCQDIEVEESNHIYYNKGGRIESFNPSNKDGYYYDQALKYEGDLFVKVKVPMSHQFMQARQRYQKNQEKLKAEKLEKKKQKAIEKAKKLLEQNQ